MSAIELPEGVWTEVATGVKALKMTLVGSEEFHEVRAYKLASGATAPAVDTVEHDLVSMPESENKPTSFNDTTSQNVYVMPINHAGRVLI